MPSKLIVWVLMAGLLLCVVSCGVALPVAARGPSAPCTVPVTQQAFDSLVNKVRAASAKHGQSVTITATDAEITSVIGRELDSVQKGSPLQFVQQPTVCFRGGLMDVYGQVSPDGTNTFNALLVLAPSLQNGHLAIGVDHLDVGPVSVPPIAAQALSQIIANALAPYTGVLPLTSVRVDQGQIVLAGQMP